MAAAAVQIVPVLTRDSHTLFDEQTRRRVPKHDVTTTLNFFKPNADGSPPAPTYIDKPETYYREPDAHEVVIKDIAGEETNFTLDRNGFQVHHQRATERQFSDDEQIKAGYYPEVEKLLKDV
ncbi:hypothetical protein NQ176_g8023 [Zarea fungicola]|uniref:Uncharacterized protein n=1 Tax=Zarea fungicola TaxID=93591 RepID=A0ACC1MVZ4_9HYPO|nr:hypothetical protein NQ176_g8023 [Lecanicillium fungicola]